MRRTWIAVGLTLLPALAMAQHPAPPPPPPVPAAPLPPPDLGRWWRNSEIAGTLGVTAPQLQKIEQIFADHRLKLIDLNADLQREEVKLEPLVAADQPDETQVGAAIDRVTAARGRLEKANALMMLAIRRVLTVEQWRKLESLKRERERPFMWAPPPPPPPAPQGPPPGDGPRREKPPAPPPPPPGQ